MSYTEAGKLAVDVVYKGKQEGQRLCPLSLSHSPSGLVPE